MSTASSSPFYYPGEDATQTSTPNSAVSTSPTTTNTSSSSSSSSSNENPTQPTTSPVKATPGTSVVPSITKNPTTTSVPVKKVPVTSPNPSADLKTSGDIKELEKYLWLIFPAAGILIFTFVDQNNSLLHGPNSSLYLGGLIAAGAFFYYYFDYRRKNKKH